MENEAFKTERNKKLEIILGDFEIRNNFVLISNFEKLWPGSALQFAIIEKETRKIKKTGVTLKDALSQVASYLNSEPLDADEEFAITKDFHQKFNTFCEENGLI